MPRKKNNIQTSVIIATLASSKRTDSLKKAISSVRKASIHDVQIIAVINGNRYDGALCQWIKRQDDIQFVYVSKPSLPNAILKGRELVETPFFSILDDDDEYLPDAIDMRINMLVNHSACDLVVSNGYVNTMQGDTIFYNNLKRVQSDPLQSLLKANWLASCGALFRTSSFGAPFFADYHPYAEWTWIAFKLGMDNKEIVILDKPTFRINNSTESLSKSVAYKNTYFSLFPKMLEKQPPPDIAKLIKKKIGAAFHDKSDNELKTGEYSKAMQSHLKSLCYPGWWRYIAFTRKFTTPWKTKK